MFFLSSCSKEPINETFENSLINVKLSSTQSELSKLNIEVLDVQFRVKEDASMPNAWVSLNTKNTGIQEITCLSQNNTLSLVDFDEISSDFIYEIKVSYGSENMAVRNGVEHVLNTDALFQNASKNIIEKQLIPNTSYEFIVEFEIDNSVEFSSNGTANFTPKMNTVMRRTGIR